MDAPVLECPSCGGAGFRLADYDSMIVITADYALFTLSCSNCGARVSTVRSIPDELHDEVRYAAIEVGAGMGQIG
ncbi:MAG: UDP-N-acetylmuramoylalanyl-D-glutamate--2,6-diaminopimelate ligase [Eggerthellaceae bacterium]|nr:UDP-N-acetylmuramoylalanyl-D-glutamate--2,6-diaminopimelate ligase [Eggerthellaceae bacterium]